MDSDHELVCARCQTTNNHLVDTGNEEYTCDKCLFCVKCTSTTDLFPTSQTEYTCGKCIGRTYGPCDLCGIWYPPKHVGKYRQADVCSKCVSNEEVMRNFNTADIPYSTEEELASKQEMDTFALEYLRKNSTSRLLKHFETKRPDLIARLKL